MTDRRKTCTRCKRRRVCGRAYGDEHFYCYKECIKLVTVRGKDRPAVR